MRRLEPEFTFAGFTFPRYIPEIHKRDKDGRTFRAVYYHAPTPLTGQKHPGEGFYLSDHGSMSRWEYADDVSGAGINHRGWYTDEFGDGETMRGLVILLPHGRFLAGWTMGKGMASAVECDCIYDDIIDAARAANSIAEYAAEAEREYQKEQRRQEELEEHNQGGDAEETEGY